jgi:hypothetical protein
MVIDEFIAVGRVICAIARDLYNLLVDVIKQIRRASINTEAIRHAGCRLDLITGLIHTQMELAPNAPLDYPWLCSSTHFPIDLNTSSIYLNITCIPPP